MDIYEKYNPVKIKKIEASIKRLQNRDKLLKLANDRKCSTITAFMLKTKESGDMSAFDIMAYINNSVSEMIITEEQVRYFFRERIRKEFPNVSLARKKTDNNGKFKKKSELSSNNNGVRLCWVPGCREEVGEGNHRLCNIHFRNAEEEPILY